jgi:hypothetical protein
LSLYDDGSGARGSLVYRPGERDPSRPAADD